MKQLRWLQNVMSDPSIGFSVLRMYLGVGLLVRGALFLSEPQALAGSLSGGGSSFASAAMSQYVAASHLCGGILLTLGLGTRIAAALQVPALLGAVFFVRYGEGLLKAGQSLELAALVSGMLVVYSVFGGGKLSLDAVLDQRADADVDSEPESTPQVQASRFPLG